MFAFSCCGGLGFLSKSIVERCGMSDFFNSMDESESEKSGSDLNLSFESKCCKIATIANGCKMYESEKE